MIWYVHRKADGSIASAHEEAQPGYADEALDDATNAEIQGWLWQARNPVPAKVPSGNFKRALYELGWYSAVDSAAQSTGGLALILWNGASEFERNHPLVIQIATAIGKTSDDLDMLFRKAATY